MKSLNKPPITSSLSELNNHGGTNNGKHQSSSSISSLAKLIGNQKERRKRLKMSVSDPFDGFMNSNSTHHHQQDDNHNGSMIMDGTGPTGPTPNATHKLLHNILREEDEEPLLLLNQSSHDNQKHDLMEKLMDHFSTISISLFHMVIKEHSTHHNSQLSPMEIRSKVVHVLERDVTNVFMFQYEYSLKKHITSVLSWFLAFHIYFIQEIALCFVKFENFDNIFVGDLSLLTTLPRKIKISSSTTHTTTEQTSTFDFYMKFLLNFVSSELVHNISMPPSSLCTNFDRITFLNLLARPTTLFESSLLQKLEKLFHLSFPNQPKIILNYSTLLHLHQSQIYSIPDYILSLPTENVIQLLAERSIFEYQFLSSNNKDGQVDPKLTSQLESVQYECLWHSTFFDKKKDTSKILKFLSTFRLWKNKEISNDNALKALIVWNEFAKNSMDQQEKRMVYIKSYIRMINVSRKIIEPSLAQSFILNELGNLLRKDTTSTINPSNSTTITATQDFIQLREPLSKSDDPTFEQAQNEVFEWFVDRLQETTASSETIISCIREALISPHVHLPTIIPLMAKLIRTHENHILTLIDESLCRAIESEDISLALTCLIVARNIYSIPKYIKTSSSYANKPTLVNNQHLSTIDQWMKDHLFMYLSTGSNTIMAGGISLERNAKSASFVCKLIDTIIPLESVTFLQMYQRVLNGITNSRHELVSQLTNKLKKQLTEMSDDNTNMTDMSNPNNENGAYFEVKNILEEYEKLGDEIFNKSAQKKGNSSAPPLVYYPLMKKNRWCNVIVPELLAFTFRKEGRDDVEFEKAKRKYDKLKFALLSSLRNRKMIPEDTTIAAKEDVNAEISGKESLNCSIQEKMTHLEGCLSRVTVEIEHQMRKHSGLMKMETICGIFYEAHILILEVLKDCEKEDTNRQLAIAKNIIQMALQTFYDCCTLTSGSNSDTQSVATLSEDTKQTHLDWIVLFKVGILIPLAHFSSIFKQSIVECLKIYLSSTISTSDSQKSNTDMCYMLSTLVASLCIISTNEVTIIREFIETLCNNEKHRPYAFSLQEALQKRYQLLRMCFEIDLIPSNFSDAIQIGQLVLAILEAISIFEKYNSGFGVAHNVFEVLDVHILEETFKVLVTNHLETILSKENRFYCLFPSSIVQLFVWIVSRYYQLFFIVESSERPLRVSFSAELVSQLLTSNPKRSTSCNRTSSHEQQTKQEDILLDQMNAMIQALSSNTMVSMFFEKTPELTFEQWLRLELLMTCEDKLSLDLYYKQHLLSYLSQTCSQSPHRSKPFVLSQFISIITQEIVLTPSPSSTRAMINTCMMNAVSSLIPKFFLVSNSHRDHDENHNEDSLSSLWLLEILLNLLQHAQSKHKRSVVRDFTTLLQHVDPIIFIIGSYSIPNSVITRTARDRNNTSKINNTNALTEWLEEALTTLTMKILNPMNSIHPWPTEFTSKILEGLLFLALLCFTACEDSQQEEEFSSSTTTLSKLFENFWSTNFILRLNLSRNLSFYSTLIESFILSHFSHNSKMQEFYAQCFGEELLTGGIQFAQTFLSEAPGSEEILLNCLLQTQNHPDGQKFLACQLTEIILHAYRGSTHDGEPYHELIHSLFNQKEEKHLSCSHTVEMLKYMKTVMMMKCSTTLQIESHPLEQTNTSQQQQQVVNLTCQQLTALASAHEEYSKAFMIQFFQCLFVTYSSLVMNNSLWNEKSVTPIFYPTQHAFQLSNGENSIYLKLMEQVMNKMIALNGNFYLDLFEKIYNLFENAQSTDFTSSIMLQLFDSIHSSKKSLDEIHPQNVRMNVYGILVVAIFKLTLSNSTLVQAIQTQLNHPEEENAMSTWINAEWYQAKFCKLVSILRKIAYVDGTEYLSSHNSTEAISILRSLLDRGLISEQEAEPEIDLMGIEFSQLE
ncbi:hypothetical protein C9374_000713 [Naegleria lovaniensis]|uniref:Uncharacterized protein n=1 Tax=Naegleria lovaniensis TaxID=51637 RepID=A0AA88GZJ5_NAELO|nr:uncharacterized protein C9374_000713 [Naegleria lovaniensis]KAG2388549.1 hypothetical protein C9374_000713 [Naegleria lovaniensis]